MEYFLALQATYTSIELAICDTSVRLCDTCTVEKIAASAHLFSVLQDMLARVSIDLGRLIFIGASQGPAPFTTLRVALACANGIAFARKIPLVSVNGIKTFVSAQYTTNHAAHIALLNAFQNNCYYAIHRENESVCGCLPIQQILDLIQQQHPTGTINFFGNGAILFTQIIKNQMGDRAYINPDAAQFPSLKSIASQALNNYRAGHTATQIEPLYLKHSV